MSRTRKDAAEDHAYRRDRSKSRKSWKGTNSLRMGADSFDGICSFGLVKKLKVQRERDKEEKDEQENISGE